jgi:hypothetical protein
MRKAKRSGMGRDLIKAMKEVVDHVEGRIALPLRYVDVPPQVNVKALRSRSGK